MLASVLGAVLSVSGVLDAYVYENDTGSPVVVGSGNAAYTLAANSLYVAATGGSSRLVKTAASRCRQGPAGRRSAQPTSNPRP